MTRITAGSDIPGFHRLALYDQHGNLVSAQDNTDSHTQTLHVECHVSSGTEVYMRLEKLPTVKRFGWMYDGVNYANRALAEAAARDDVTPHSWEELA